MAHNVDEMLGRLKALPRDHELDRLESAVLSPGSRPDSDAFAGKTLQVQLAVTCGALLLGLAVAQFASIEPDGGDAAAQRDDGAVGRQLVCAVRAARGRHMSAFWRNLAITVVVALAAGWAGGALGVRTLAPGGDAAAAADRCRPSCAAI